MKRFYRCSLRLLWAALAFFLWGSEVLAAPSGSDKFNIFDFKGPKMKDLYYVIVRDMDAQLLAMSTGKLDVLSDLYRPADVERLAVSGVADLSLASTFHGFFITFNVRKFPWDQKTLRQAASQVVERRKWVRDLFSGYCEPLTSFLPPVSPYHYRVETSPVETLASETPSSETPSSKTLLSGVAGARKRLADEGWTWNLAGWLVAPDGRAVPPVRILCPPSSVAATTTEIAQLMAEALLSIGVPAEAEPMDFQTMLARVDARDFDACTNAWTMSRDPDVLHSFYHSSMDVEGGYNLSGIADPELDRVLHNLRYAPDEATARIMASEAQKLLADLVPVIPLYSRYSISAVRNDWEGVFTTDRSTADNLLTLISMTPKTKEEKSEKSERPIYWNIPEEIRTLNPLVSSTAYDWTVLGTVYDTLLSTDPYTFEDIPWLAESWSIAQGEMGSVLTFTLRPGLKWQDGRPLTVEDVAFSLQYIKDNNVPRFYDSVKDIASIDVKAVDVNAAERTLRIFMANTSYWHLHNIGGMLVLPKHILENVPDWRGWQPTNRPHLALDGTVMTELVGTGPFTFRESRTGEYVHMTRNPHYMLLHSESEKNLGENITDNMTDNIMENRMEN
ncbi:MAG: ABC transporter substrate-binding protein [Synergistaceae bacterium]|jgi:peptide/nickel transport system substrate-binding protein|nr:ABC transporter substrate-binding protein [Synergistaceae bacterium]